MKTLLLVSLILQSWSLPAQNDRIDALVEKGNKYYDDRKYADAIANYREALSIDSNAPRPNYEMANTMIALKKYPAALAFSDKVIKTNTDYLDQAYTIKGTALDLMQQFGPAIQAYKEGLERFPKSYILSYNIALTYFNAKQYRETELYALQALKNNPLHTSSHLLLAQCMYYEGKRVQSLLSLYYFLLLEPDTKRSEGALALLNRQMGAGVSADGKNNVNISVSEQSATDEFGPADLMLSMMQALKYDDKNKAKSEEEVFSEHTKSFFNMLSELKDKKKENNIWWDFYVPFFDKLEKSGNTEAYCYFISATKNSDGVNKWVNDHPDKLEKFTEWTKDFHD